MPIERIIEPPAIPERPADGHKGLFGRVLVVGGSDNMIAMRRCWRAHPRRAWDRAWCRSPVLGSICSRPRLSITPELIGLALGKTIAKDFLEAIDSADAIVVGPGMGQSPEAKKRLKRLIGFEKPMVIDADALNMLSAMKKHWPAQNSIRTPSSHRIPAR